MSVSLESLSSRLAGLVPVRDGVPGDYDQLVKDAVSDFSSRVPLMRRSSLSIVSGTAAYALPADYAGELRWDEVGVRDGGTLITTDGALLPTYGADERYDEQWEIAGQTLTLFPTPTYSQTRYFWYSAEHVLESDSYPYLQASQASVMLLKAQALGLRQQAAAAAQEAWRYQTGDQTVDKQRLADALLSVAQGVEADYLRAVDRLVGPIVRLG